MRHQIINKFFLLCLLMFSLTSVSFGTAELKHESEAENDIDLFLWFAELDAEQAEVLASKDPDELEHELESSEKLLTKRDKQPIEEPSIPTLTLDSEK